jgi:hypothetical protein
VYGKLFASMYTGSMFGKPALVFALMGYAVANMRPSRKDGECYVEINPTLLAATFAASAEEVLDALEVLQAPDLGSRTRANDGRRLIAVEKGSQSGPQQFRVVNGSHYRAIRDEDERREYLREAKRRERSRKRVNNVNHGQPQSSQGEAEVKSEVKVKDSLESAPQPPSDGGGTAERTRRSRASHPLPADFTPSDTVAKLAHELRLDLAAEVVQFADNAAATGKRRADWNADLRVWLRRSAKYRDEKPRSTKGGTDDADVRAYANRHFDGR